MVRNRSERAEMSRRRRNRWLAIHAGLFLIVNAFMIGTWAMSRGAPSSSAESRPPQEFWPGWLIVTWGCALALHALYVWARRPTGAAVASSADAQRGRIVGTVLFTDIVGSTELAAQLGDRRWGELLNRHDEVADRLVKRFGGRIVKHTGDGVLALLPTPNDAINCAKALRDDLREQGLEIRAGLHVGEVDRRGDDVGGIGVHIASRVMAAAQPSEILVSRTVRDLVTGSEIAFADRGAHHLRGVQGEWQLFSVAHA